MKALLEVLKLDVLDVITASTGEDSEGGEEEAP